MSRSALACSLALAFTVGHCRADTADDLFRGHIRSLLAEKCFACHGPDVQEAELRLDTRDEAVAKLDSGAAAVVPGDDQASELIRRVTIDDPDSRMPPEGDPLSADQIGQLRQWIKGGAPYAQHWAYTTLNPGNPPPVKQQAWIANPIDQYVLARLAEQGIAPSERADKYTLIKRLYYDLVGLPPTPAAVEQFVHDTDPHAYERLVDALLNSNHFGERWGRHWLDKARYADSDGYEKDRPRPNAWKYRDWVIDAINADMPVDQFTVQQLAGDLLPDATSEQVLATAFHRQTLTNTEGGVDQEEFRVEAVFDRTETTGAIWLGLTVGCARCHSHKYDAISQDEYYRLFAFFNNGDEATIKVPRSAAALEAYQTAESEHDRQLDELNRRIAEAKNGWETDFDQWQTELQNKLTELEPIQLHDLTVSEVTASVAGHQFQPPARRQLSRCG